MKDKQIIIEKSSGGVSASSLLGIVLVTLKLLGYIDWSWWAVTSPFWAPAVLLLVILAFMLVIAGITLIIAFVAALITK